MFINKDLYSIGSAKGQSITKAIDTVYYVSLSWVGLVFRSIVLVGHWNRQVINVTVLLLLSVLKVVKLTVYHSFQWWHHKCLDNHSNPFNYTISHYSDVIMSVKAPQIISLMIVYSTVYLGTDQRKHQSSVSPAFVQEFTGHWWIPCTKGQQYRK